MNNYCYMSDQCEQLGKCLGNCNPDLREMLRALQYAVTLRQKAINRGIGGRELALVQTKLDEARLWLGEFEAATEGE